MPKKRRNRGRNLKNSGHEKTVQCYKCHRLVPADKAIKVTVWTSPIQGSVAKDLEKKGAYVSKRLETRYYCISCAIFYGIVSPRKEEERKVRSPLQRPLTGRRTSSKVPLKFLKI